MGSELIKCLKPVLEDPPNAIGDKSAIPAFLASMQDLWDADDGAGVHEFHEDCPVLQTDEANKYGEKSAVIGLHPALEKFDLALEKNGYTSPNPRK